MGLISIHSFTTAISIMEKIFILNIHNMYRLKHHSPPLLWDTQLESYSQQWSSHCAFVHSGGPYGENIGFGQKDWGSVIGQWYNEFSLYDYNRPVFDVKTAHFTSIVWKSTTRIGCGVQQCPNLGGYMYTCSYSPAGNIVSQSNIYFTSNVLIP
ncbi:CAP domain-containing protein [Pilobolus umbonatus]|nr:CAP domain-containing protein [Pilobolus umbonatus]